MAYKTRLTVCGRTLTSYVDDERQPWFYLKDILTILPLSLLTWKVNKPDIDPASFGSADGLTLISAGGVLQLVRNLSNSEASPFLRRKVRLAVRHAVRETNVPEGQGPVVLKHVPVNRESVLDMYQDQLNVERASKPYGERALPDEKTMLSRLQASLGVENSDDLVRVLYERAEQRGELR